ncbi:hypothetical protein F4778DRAFT_337172 [Xylariomycetidae sp. FL2044]|nr:hypothetical protein F4778DRAFT_337172 [Xylariomycetidae sp. FL2044]
MCLHHAFVKMEQINLLVIDEAHHTKSNHPYARIIKEFYAVKGSEGKRRPRIFGMTASPVDAKTDVDAAAARLEGLLHSTIATVADPTVFTKSSITRPEEHSIPYGVLPTPYETVLWQKLWKVVGHNAVFTKYFNYSRDCTADLGRWCADRVWQISLTRTEAEKMEARTERNMMRKENALQPIYAVDSERALVREAYQIIQAHPVEKPKVTPYLMSSKVLALIGRLRADFNPATDKCIIFVEQRLTAILLADLFKDPAVMPDIKPGVLIGASSQDTGDVSNTIREQILTMHHFRHGDMNCVFATSVGEEGIDIPDCNIVIRFDLCKTMIQYIQSRGRARHLNSKFFHMVEAGNCAHSQSIFENEDSEQRLRMFCSALPEDRLLKGNDYDMDYFLSKERNQEVRYIPGTGAKLTYRMSLVVLANFVSSLPHPAGVEYNVEYMIRKIGQEYQCEVTLPESSPVISAMGKRKTSKQVAKCSAAFALCDKLWKSGYLDDYLQSTFKKVLPAMRNACLALSSKKRSEYPMRIKPQIWSTRGTPDLLFVTIFKLSSPEALGRYSKPLAILTREALPHLPKFPLYFGNHRTSELVCVPLKRAIEVNLDDIETLNRFTLRIFKDIFSKEYKPDYEAMPYFLAPIVYEHSFDYGQAISDTRTVIDWDCLSWLNLSPSKLDWENQADEFFVDKFVTDPHDGSRKFYITHRRKDLKPTDPQVPGVPLGQHSRKARDGPKDIWNFSVSLWSKSRAKLPVRNDLPVVEAEYIPLRRNLLDEFEKVDKAQLKCYLTFATLEISPLPLSVVAMAYNIPAIIYRLESNLIALDACRELGLEIRPDLALEAMTKDSDNTEEHTEEQINVQRGMGNNYERLEFLGDSFLKMSTTIALFAQVQDGDEFQYHVDRMVLICNKNLFNTALDLKLEEYVRSKGFNRRLWYPEGLELLRGKQNTSIIGKKGAGRGTHVLADKSIADVCEALIGAAYMTTYPQRNFDLAIQAVTKFVNHKDHPFTTYGDYFAAYQIPEWQSAAPTAVQRDLARQIEERLGYKFRHPRLLRSAFMHPSYGTMYERIPNYQRLEFLGDALLDVVCVDFLFHRFPKADPQWLTEHKMAMVSNQFLGCLCVSLNLHTHMLSITASLHKEVAEYVLAITEARRRAEQEAESAQLGRAAYARNFWMKEKKPPKCLPDIVEAFIGALFVDNDFDYGKVQHFFDVHVRPYFEDMHLYDTYANKHPVTYLTNRLQMSYGCSAWRLMIDEVNDEERSISDTKVICAAIVHGKVVEFATAASGRYAKIAAATKLIEKLKQMSVEEFRHEYECDCRQEGSDDVAPPVTDMQTHNQG